MGWHAPPAVALPLSRGALTLRPRTVLPPGPPALTVGTEVGGGTPETPADSPRADHRTRSGKLRPRGFPRPPATPPSARVGEPAGASARPGPLRDPLRTHTDRSPTGAVTRKASKRRRVSPLRPPHALAGEPQGDPRHPREAGMARPARRGPAAEPWSPHPRPIARNEHQSPCRRASRLRPQRIRRSGNPGGRMAPPALALSHAGGAWSGTCLGAEAFDF